jgi:hypothetical protein
MAYISNVCGGANRGYSSISACTFDTQAALINGVDMISPSIDSPNFMAGICKQSCID